MNEQPKFLLPSVCLLSKAGRPHDCGVFFSPFEGKKEEENRKE